MPRRLRVSSGGYVYHVLNRAVGKMCIFGKRRDFEAFEEVIGQAKQRLPMRVLAWSVLSNPASPKQRWKQWSARWCVAPHLAPPCGKSGRPSD